MTHKLEKNNTKELLPLLQRFWTPHQSSQSGDLTKGLGIPGDLTLKAGRIFLQDFHKVEETEFQSLRAQKKSCVYQDAKERSNDPTEDWPNYLLVFEGLLWRRGLAGAHHRDGGTGSCSPGRLPLVLTTLEVTVNTTTEPVDLRTGLPQAKKTTK